MCGRYTLATPLDSLLELFGISAPDPDLRSLPPRFNIAPTELVAAVRQEPSGGRRLDRLRWGLVPPWQDDPKAGPLLLNARVESVATKPSFRDAYQHRRCLIPADGFYEWQKRARGKQPYLIHLPEGRPFAFAGLWERWRRGDAYLVSCTIITTAANPLVATLHDRMPVVISPEHWDAWLDPSTPVEELPALLGSAPSELFELHPVSRRVGNVANDDASLLEPVEDEDEPRDAQLALF